MTEQKSWILSKHEAEEMLRNCLDDKLICLKRRKETDFYYAESDSQKLDGEQVDKRMAECLDINECQQYCIRNEYDDEFMIVIEV